jgi:hypothetical protein
LDEIGENSFVYEQLPAFFLPLMAKKLILLEEYYAKWKRKTKESLLLLKSDADQISKFLVLHLDEC